DCIAWCGSRRQPDGRWMNQGYLERWPERYPGVAIIGHPGANLALWNVETTPVARVARGLTVGGRPLVFFHYGSMRPTAAGDWSSLFPLPPSLAPLLREAIYAPYFDAVGRVSRRLRARHGIRGTETGRGFGAGQVTWLTGWRSRLPLYHHATRAYPPLFQTSRPPPYHRKVAPNPSP